LAVGGGQMEKRSSLFFQVDNNNYRNGIASEFRHFCKCQRENRKHAKQFLETLAYCDNSNGLCLRPRVQQYCVSFDTLKIMEPERINLLPVQLEMLAVSPPPRNDNHQMQQSTLIMLLRTTELYWWTKGTTFI
jgi:hypothetical protein